MSRVPDFYEIYDRVLPEDLSAKANETGVDAEDDVIVAEEIATHIDELVDIVDDMEAAFCTGKEKSAHLLRQFYNDLLRVAAELIDQDTIFANKVGLVLAAIVIGKGGDIEWANRLSVFFVEDAEAEIYLHKGEQAQDLELFNETEKAEQSFEEVNLEALYGAEDPEILRQQKLLNAQMDYAYALFVAGRILPPSSAAEIWHARTRHHMCALAREHIEDFTTLFLTCMTSLDEPEKFPGALLLIQDVYCEGSSLFRQDIYDDLLVRDAGETALLLRKMIYLDAIIIVNLMDREKLAQIAIDNFTKNWALLREVDVIEAYNVLTDLYNSYESASNELIGAPMGIGTLFEIISSRPTLEIEYEDSEPMRPEVFRQKLKITVSTDCLLEKIPALSAPITLTQG